MSSCLMFVILVIQLFIFHFSHQSLLMIHSCFHMVTPDSLVQILLLFTIHPSVEVFPTAPTLSLFPSLL